MVVDLDSRRRLPAPSDWEVRLHDVLGGGSVLAHYQPIVDLRRGVVVGYEALARFVDGTPLGWFEAARAHGRLATLEAAAMRAALAGRARLPVNTFLTLNVGPDVIGHPEVCEVWAAESSLAGVVVELTEHVPVDSYRPLMRTLDSLRSAGAMIAIDDAGAGYSGLRHLLHLKPDIVKLDRALVSDLDRDETRRALVDMMGTFAGRMDAWVLAEGVETRAELETLARLGVPLAQGFYLGRPSPDWQALDAEVAAQLRSLAAPATGPRLRSLVEGAPTALDAAEARTVLQRDRAEFVVLLDDHGRPASLLRSRGALQSAHVPKILMNLDTPVSQAAQRAITRGSGERFLPLLCVDDTGRFVGLVRMERVVEHLSAPAGE